MVLLQAYETPYNFDNSSITFFLFRQEKKGTVG
jgi:hypothetical protein